MNTDDLRQRNGVEHERIARRAHELYEARRCQSGHADEDWFLAEMDLRRGGGSTEEDRISAESARNEAEQLRRLAEAAREVRDEHREAIVDALRATADTFKANLEQMKVVEEMRRDLRDIRDINKLDSN